MNVEDKPQTLPWRETGVWLVGDTHVHYRLEGMDRVLEGAAPHCDVLAFTEHSHLTEAFEKQPEEIERMRAAYPDKVLVNGAEYNTLGTQHAALLVPGNREAMPFFRDFLNRFDSQIAGREITEEIFLEGLRFLSSAGEGDCRPTIVFNHPKREPDYWLALIERAFDCGPAVIGLCGSSRPPARGDREVWPWIADVGGLYDRLLHRGHRVVATAESHIHRHDIAKGGVEFWPGEFRKTFVYCPERSESGFFAGLRSGAGYFVLGGIVEDVDFRVWSGEEWAMPGESLRASPGQRLTIEVSCTQLSKLEFIEVIGDLDSAPAVISELSVADGDRATCRTQIEAPRTPGYVRARGSAYVERPYPVQAWFYTNPIWIHPAA